ncbi:MAG: hypothetical protein KDA72_04040, partial [Planctomycetales bacterium]|nr:hypothetical protein [Planctomycetales bacterium]
MAPDFVLVLVIARHRLRNPCYRAFEQTKAGINPRTPEWVTISSVAFIHENKELSDAWRGEVANVVGVCAAG